MTDTENLDKNVPNREARKCWWPETGTETCWWKGRITQEVRATGQVVKGTEGKLILHGTVIIITNCWKPPVFFKIEMMILRGDNRLEITRCRFKFWFFLLYLRSKKRKKERKENEYLGSTSNCQALNQVVDLVSLNSTSVDYFLQVSKSQFLIL